ncbi:hypothetical protein BU24DRAFT_281217 [Aaosphaeria arxii CBS 175.79]|uniref:Uncharacterized protein n=1 Tax=Aaosphaeria arxii CBS 175.79 TaxID=1450172 RepID=A0A6A5XEU2_9PLEO|nr:uncharacterized protein BU24DRAFT_281217 [Aaosphaeria arxii CBS 175.79]KAF2011440.1 hypothetical protein BU24DRAFT_281217 [Aaosphaeria arxii CBS 175.79]
MTTVGRLDRNQVTYPSHVAQQAVQIGGAASIPGFVIGAFTGTLRTSTPILFSLVSGIQWFALGTTFWAVRTSVLNHVGLQNWWNSTRGAPILPRTDLSPSHSDRLRASTISGGVTGAVLGALFRGPRNIIPGTIMFTLFGFGGQHAYDFLDQKNTEQVQKDDVTEEGAKEKGTWLQRAAKSKWSPMKVLSDEEYLEMMNEKVLSVEAEIALLDDKIEELRKQQKELEKSKPSENEKK